MTAEEILAKIDKKKYKSERWITVDEAMILQDLAKDYKLAYESGTANGFSTACLLAAMGKGSTIFTFDPIYRIKVWDNLDLSLGSINFVLSEFASIALLPVPTEPAFYFVDGGHSRNQVANDWNAIEPRLKTADMVVFHDVLSESGSRKHWIALSKQQRYGVRTIETKRGMGVLRLI